MTIFEADTDKLDNEGLRAAMNRFRSMVRYELLRRKTLRHLLHEATKGNNEDQVAARLTGRYAFDIDLRLQAQVMLDTFSQNDDDYPDQITDDEGNEHVVPVQCQPTR